MSPFFKFGFFLITGAFVALLVTGDATPLITAMVALFILYKLFGGSSGSGGGGAGSAKNRHRHCRRHRWYRPDSDDDDLHFRDLAS